ncbi:hypothetical protein EHQ75_13485 [Leptospira levettii]|uniref:hypothetical protein n=1 Tax=Leptospira levettii TaxID=2023178 RepID=UPI00108230A3|nr:hypothetical protein [Leptospira levettii]TGM36174.1 hypothetical protein EHQ75_13485 [Leptospira levettii]
MSLTKYILFFLYLLIHIHCDFVGTVSIENPRENTTKVELNFQECFTKIPDCFERPFLYSKTKNGQYIHEDNIKKYLSFSKCKIFLDIPANSTFYISYVLNDSNTNCIPQLTKIKYGTETSFIEIKGDEIPNSFHSKNGINFELKIPEKNKYIP